MDTTSAAARLNRRGRTPVMPLPESADDMKAIVNLRGAVLPIIDLALRLGLPSAEPTAPRDHRGPVPASSYRAKGLGY